MAEQFSNAPAPSREEFEDLADNLSNLASDINGGKIAICNIKYFGKYIGSAGTYIDYFPYCIVEIPVLEGNIINVLTSASNNATYSFFANASDQRIGDLIQHRYTLGWGREVTAPSGAVKLLVSQFADTGVVLIDRH